MRKADQTITNKAQRQWQQWIRDSDWYWNTVSFQGEPKVARDGTEVRISMLSPSTRHKSLMDNHLSHFCPFDLIKPDVDFYMRIQRNIILTLLIQYLYTSFAVLVMKNINKNMMNTPTIGFYKYKLAANIQ